MFSFFMDLHRWRHEISALGYDAWGAKMIDRDRDHVYRQRRVILRGGKVPWIDNNTEVQLKELWTKDPKFKTRSERGQENMNRFEAKHTQGSVSTIHVTKKMKKELKGKLARMEVFENTHTKKGTESDEVVWCDERSKEMTTQYSVLEKEIMDQLLAKREPGTKLIEEKIKDAQNQAYLWAARCKKAPFYALDSASSMFYSKDSLSLHSMSFVDNSRVAAQEESNATLATKVEALTQVVEHLAQRLTQCGSIPRDPPPHHPRDPPSPPSVREQKSSVAAFSGF